jgi:hypothetical protein
MTLNDLIQRLEEIRQEVGGETDVRLAHQPNYPFEYSIAGIVVGKVDEDEIDPRIPGPVIGGVGPDGPPVYILEGSQLGYASRSLWDEQ